jgi:hypothetical protein
MANGARKVNRKGMMIHWIFLALAIFGAYFVWQKYVAKRIWKWMTAEERRLEKIEERLTDVRLVLSALEWQLKDLIIWKQVAEIQLTEIVKAEEIADAISKRIHRTNTIRFTFVQKTLGSLVGVAALSDFILRLSGKGWMNRPAEIGGVAGAIAFLIARVAGLHDPTTVTAIGTVVGFVPAAITWIVVKIKGTPDKPGNKWWGLVWSSHSLVMRSCIGVSNPSKEILKIHS